MKNIFLLLMGMIVTLVVDAQTNADSFDLGKWNKEVLTEANTAKDVNYLDEEEKELIFLTNLARLNGELFSETILDIYLKDKKSSRYTRSLYRDLKKVKNLPPLDPEEDLYKAALEHAETSGKRGTTGHQRFGKRYDPLMKNYNEIGENLAYGYRSAPDILIQLLIDEGIPDLGHRKNLLNPNFNSIGVAIESHKKYRFNCVMSFGKKVK